MPKWTKEREEYGELMNITIPSQFTDRLIANWKHEYSKAFNVYRLKMEDLGAEFNWTCQWTKKKPIRPYKIIGQLSQALLLVQRTDTKRFYRMPTRDVAKALELQLPLAEA